MFLTDHLNLLISQLNTTFKRSKLFDNIECIPAVLNYNFIYTRTVHNLTPIFNGVDFIEKNLWKEGTD